MDPFHFACPHCSSRLRVREKLYVGRQVDCPECGDTLLIVERGGELGVERIEPKPQGPANGPDRKRKSAQSSAAIIDRPTPAGIVATGQPVDSSKVAGSGPRADEPTKSDARIVFRRRLFFVSLGAGGVIVAGIVALVLAPGSRGPAESQKGAPLNVAADRSGKLPDDGAGRAKRDADEPGKGSPEDQPRDELETRLSKIGQMLLEQADVERGFPRGTVPATKIAPENRLSWMAVLADRLDDGAAPELHWDLAWNDPRNDAYVRRRLTAFQNPAIGPLTGADGYPATHFAGVAGVGADAARLDNRHARAGIFGYDRQARLEDIRDGASNTLLVMGVGDHLGSWAAGGQATVRGLAREPYVNGPDGFSTGAPDSMLVLMADGRVQTVTRQTDPRIIRRMAAKADGLPLDLSEPGEPGDRPSLLAADESAATPAAGQDEESGENELAADDRPIEPEFASEKVAPPARKIDLAASLKQPIARFDQPRSKPLEEVLTSVAEMAGARIAFDRDELGPAAARLAEPMALKLENTTVGDILSGLLGPAGLAYRIEGDHLRVIRRE